MEPQIAKRLLELNHQFYQTFAGEFSKTRQRIQPGVRRILQDIPPLASILDLGCGNGETLREFRRQGYRGRYIGLDASPRLLEIARDEVAGESERFLLANLAHPGWAENILTT
ncbi:MAG: methyltransferase domain-containing protein [Anaerolineales bacterium]|nr:methyltransferase domain-containing protein [Anaerolineales bacterium]